MADQLLMLALIDSLNVIATFSNPKRRVNSLATSLYPSRLTSPLVTSVSLALIQNTSAASSSFAIHTSTYSQILAMTSPAFSFDHNLLR